MNIAQALKQKNRLVGEMNKLFTYVVKHNVSTTKAGSEDKSQVKDIKEAFTKLMDTFEKLVAIKTATQTASAPIARKLVEIAETKNILSKISSIPVRELVEIQQGYGKEPFEIKYTSQITEEEQINTVSGLQERINTLQDEIDAFNATTQVPLWHFGFGRTGQKWEDPYVGASLHY